MKKLKEVHETEPHRKATTVEAREDQMIALAVDLAEQQLRDGTASSQVITHYLKLGSTKERLEKELLIEQTKVAAAKAEAIQSTKRIEELYEEAIASMKLYSGATYDKPED